jgi:hypothetical protein
MDDLLQPDVPLPAIPRRTSEFVVYLKDQERRIAKERQQARPPPSDPPPLAMVEFAEPKSAALFAGFSAWLRAELAAGGEPGEDPAEVDSLVESVARRLTAVARLHHSILVLKQEKLKPEELECADCEPERLRDSPFFTGLQDGCRFMLSAFRALQAEQALIPKCCGYLAKCDALLVEVADESRAAWAAIQRHTAEMQEMAAQKAHEADELQQELQPFIDELLGKPPVLAEPDDEIEATLPEILGVSFVEPTKIEDWIARFQKLRERLVKITRLNDETAALKAQMADEGRKLILFRLEQFQAEEEARMEQQQEEIDMIEKYEDGLKDLLDSVRFSEISAWCNELDEIWTNFAELAEGQEAIISELQELTEAKDLPEQIAAKHKEIQELSAINYGLCQEIGEVELELRTMSAEGFRVAEGLEKWGIALPQYVDPNNQEQVKEYVFRLFCPICKSNYRDCFLMSCQHVMCRSCLEGLAVKRCPLCLEPFTEAAMRPFLFR